MKQLKREIENYKKQSILLHQLVWEKIHKDPILSEYHIIESFCSEFAPFAPTNNSFLCGLFYENRCFNCPFIIYGKKNHRPHPCMAISSPMRDMILNKSRNIISKKWKANLVKRIFETKNNCYPFNRASAKTNRYFYNLGIEK